MLGILALPRALGNLLGQFARAVPSGLLAAGPLHEGPFPSGLDGVGLAATGLRQPCLGLFTGLFATSPGLGYLYLGLSIAAL